MVPAPFLTFSRQCLRSPSTSSSSSRALRPILTGAEQLFAHDRAMLRNDSTHNCHYIGDQHHTPSYSSSHWLHGVGSSPSPSQQQHESTWITFTAQPQLVSNPSSNAAQPSPTRCSDLCPPSQKRRRTSPGTAGYGFAQYTAQPWTIGQTQTIFSPPVENWPPFNTTNNFRPRTAPPRGRPTILRPFPNVSHVTGQTQRCMHVEAVPNSDLGHQPSR